MNVTGLALDAPLDRAWGNSGLTPGLVWIGSRTWIILQLELKHLEMYLHTKLYDCIHMHILEHV